MTASHLRLSAAHADFIVREAQRAHPQECCGLLLGQGESEVAVTEVVATANLADHPEQAFAIDPQHQFDALRAARGGPTHIIGHYHSHPHGEAVPSARDLAMAHDPAAIWLIVSAAGEIRAYRRAADAKGFTEITLLLSGEG
jgi:proteasome lid subunit RPN8/RPN11